MSTLTDETLDYLVTALVVTTPSPTLPAEIVTRADNLGQRIRNLKGDASPYAWTPAFDVYRNEWLPSTAHTVEAARLVVFDGILLPALEADEQLWRLLAGLGIALAMALEPLTSADHTRALHVSDFFLLSELSHDGTEPWSS